MFSMFDELFVDTKDGDIVSSLITAFSGFVSASKNITGDDSSYVSQLAP